MHRDSNRISAGGFFILLVVLLNGIVLERGLVSGTSWYQLLYITLPLFFISIFVFFRKK